MNQKLLTPAANSYMKAMSVKAKEKQNKRKFRTAERKGYAQDSLTSFGESFQPYPMALYKKMKLAQVVIHNHLLLHDHRRTVLIPLRETMTKYVRQEPKRDDDETLTSLNTSGDVINM